jgi:hypothetical protein
MVEVMIAAEKGSRWILFGWTVPLLLRDRVPPLTQDHGQRSVMKGGVDST